MADCKRRGSHPRVASRFPPSVRTLGFDARDSRRLAFVPSRIAGVDGCSRGWFRVSLEIGTGELRFAVVEHVRGLLIGPPTLKLVCIDIPIGLTDGGRRSCDQEARKLLGSPRASSVFPAPIRPAIQAASREEAAEITESRDGRRVGAQAWGIFPKVREVDFFLRAEPAAREHMIEVHPEVSFWAWSGQQPMKAGKKTPEGKRARRALVEAEFGTDAFEAARRLYTRGNVADDDILDAYAALWTAQRVFAKRANSVPGDQPLDSAGLPMRIVY